jgi:hypothetical protein
MIFGHPPHRISQRSISTLRDIGYWKKKIIKMQRKGKRKTGSKKGKEWLLM